jgi:hypothetical protein
MATLNFDATQVDPKAGFEPIPVGQYEVVITESEEKPNSKGTGTYHQFTFEVIDGEYKGRKLWARLNLNNPNQTAVDIARSELSAICRAVGVMKPIDSTDLHDLPLVIKVGMEKRGDTGELQNKITGYVAKEQAPKSTPAPAATGAGAAPWKRK